MKDSKQTLINRMNYYRELFEKSGKPEYFTQYLTYQTALAIYEHSIVTH